MFFYNAQEPVSLTNILHSTPWINVRADEENGIRENGWNAPKLKTYKDFPPLC